MSTFRAMLTISTFAFFPLAFIGGGCSSPTVQNASANGPTVATVDGLDVFLDSQNGSTTVASINDPDSAMNLIMVLDSTGGGAGTLTGTTDENASFDATFAGTAPASFTVAGEEFLIEQVDDYTFDVTEVLSTSARTENRAQQTSRPTLRVTISTTFFNAGRTVVTEFVKCYNSIVCPPSRLRKLNVLTSFVLLEAIADHLFNERCLDTDIFGPDRCRQLLGTIAMLGESADAFIAANPDFSPDIRALCFRLADDCDTLIYAPQSPDFNDTTDEPDPPTVTVAISGPDEIKAGGLAAYYAAATGATVEFTWDLLGSAATLTGTSGWSTTVQAGSTLGTVTLVAEARMPDTGAVAATATHTISIIAPEDYVVWYDPESTCWDAPGIKVTSRATFEEEANAIEMQSGFATREDGIAWVCSQVEARFQHAWCGSQEMIGGQWFMVPYYWDCDDTNVPWVESK